VPVTNCGERLTDWKCLIDFRGVLTNGFDGGFLKLALRVSRKFVLGCEKPTKAEAITVKNRKKTQYKG
jgi:hypothetical protein